MALDETDHEMIYDGLNRIAAALERLGPHPKCPACGCVDGVEGWGELCDRCLKPREGEQRDG